MLTDLLLVRHISLTFVCSRNVVPGVVVRYLQAVNRVNTLVYMDMCCWFSMIVVGYMSIINMLYAPKHSVGFYR